MKAPTIITLQTAWVSKKTQPYMTDLKIIIQYHMACVGDMLSQNWICEACKASVPTQGGKRE